MISMGEGLKDAKLLSRCDTYTTLVVSGSLTTGGNEWSNASKIVGTITGIDQAQSVNSIAAGPPLPGGTLQQGNASIYQFDLILVRNNVQGVAGSSPSTIADPWWPLPEDWTGRVIFEHQNYIGQAPPFQTWWVETSDVINETGLQFANTPPGIQGTRQNHQFPSVAETHPLLQDVDLTVGMFTPGSNVNGTNPIGGVHADEWISQGSIIDIAENTVQSPTGHLISYVYQPVTPGTSGGYNEQYWNNLKTVLPTPNGTLIPNGNQTN